MSNNNKKKNNKNKGSPSSDGDGHAIKKARRDDGSSSGGSSGGGSGSGGMECFVCNRSYKQTAIEDHVRDCLQGALQPKDREQSRGYILFKMEAKHMGRKYALYLKALDDTS